jgi:hypothetical protein
MRRWKSAAALAVLASICFVGLSPEAVRGDEAARAKPADVVGTLMKALHANKGAVRVGMSVSSADKATAGAANHLDTRFLALRGSWLDKEGRLDGTIEWEVDLDQGKKVDCIRVVLVVEPFDKKEMGRAIVAAGKEFGADLKADDENPDTWFDEETMDREVWVTIGEGVVVMDVQSLSD